MHWEPQYGDLITRSRILTWWGYVMGYNAATEEVVVVRAANPHILLGLTPKEADARAVKMDLAKMRKSRGYAALQVRNGQPIWYLS